MTRAASHEDGASPAADVRSSPASTRSTALLQQTTREKTKLLNRVRRIRGQIEAVERALEANIGCADVLQLITAARGALNGLMGEVIEDHIRTHLVHPPLQPGDTADAADELIDVIRCYLK
jgi:DNA-binding FrmR family transcriptional regulator